MTRVSANQTKCYLIYTGEDYLIRVYGKDYTFKDYSILHSDLGFVIDDEDAFLFEDGDKLWIDHAPHDLNARMQALTELTKLSQELGLYDIPENADEDHKVAEFDKFLEQTADIYNRRVDPDRPKALSYNEAEWDAFDAAWKFKSKT